MKKQNILIITLLTLLFNSGFTEPDNTISQFDWLIGTWQGKSGNGEVFENWRRLDESTLVGEGYFVVKNDTVFREMLRIQQIGNFWTYIPVVNKNQPVLFTLTKSEKAKWVFENKEHDFPKKIVYEQVADGSMLAWVEGKMLGKTMKEEYRMQKLK
jgi:hypothetical protein